MDKICTEALGIIAYALACPASLVPRHTAHGRDCYLKYDLYTKASDFLISVDSLALQIGRLNKLCIKSASSLMIEHDTIKFCLFRSLLGKPSTKRRKTMGKEPCRIK